MSAEQTYTSRDSQENATSSNALSINDGSSQGLSLQRKANAMQNNTGVMQRMAWEATKPLDKLSEISAKIPIPNSVKPLVGKTAKKAGTQALDFVGDVLETDIAGVVLDGSGRVLNGIGVVADGASYVFDDVAHNMDDASRFWKDLDHAADSWPWYGLPAKLIIKAEGFIADRIGGGANAASSGANSVSRVIKGTATFVKNARENVNFAKDFVDAIDVCDTADCTTPEVSYKIGDPNDEMPDISSRWPWHKHIIFGPVDLSEQSYVGECQGKEHKYDTNVNVKTDISGRIERLTGVCVPGPSNIGFTTENGQFEKGSYVGTGKLFSENVLHKNYTQKKLISSTPEQDEKLMSAIEQNAPPSAFPKYDLLNSNCQHWVEKVKADAK